MRRLGWGAILVAALALCPRPAQAQPAAHNGRVEVAVGPRWVGGVTFPAVAAPETGANGQPFPLFTTRTRIEPSVGVDIGAGVRLTRLLQIAGGVSLAKPQLTTEVSGDVEGAAPIRVSEQLWRIAAEGGVRMRLPRWELPGHGTPFATAGAGYLRELHEGQTLVETGLVSFAGGGVEYVSTARPGSIVKALGLRVEVRAVVRSGGVSEDDRTHVTPALSATALVRF